MSDRDELTAARALAERRGHYIQELRAQLREARARLAATRSGETQRDSCDHSPAGLQVVEWNQCECGALVDVDAGCAFYLTDAR